MINRIEQKFAELKRKKQKAFIAFITAGHPNLKTTEELVYALEAAGVDIIELGVPFSDPLADGPTIQSASYQALKNKVNIEKIFQLVKNVRQRSQIPIALMTYYNPVFHYGEYRFVLDAKRNGVDGVIIPDLPPEEAQLLIELSKLTNLSTIFFLSPTTTAKRIKEVVNASSGFIYFVSVAGVTGARKSIAASVLKQIKQAKKQTQKPICVGFGISTSEQVRAFSKIADGVIVGSAIVSVIEKNKKNKALIEKVTAFVKPLIGSLKNV